MPITAFSRPLASTPKDVEEIEAALRGDDGGKKTRHHQSMTVGLDPRFSKVISWIGVIFTGVITWAICWSAGATVELEKQMVGVQRDIAALVARPEGISREEYNRDAKRWDDDIYALKQQHHR